jgi:hypothetical protein
MNSLVTFGAETQRTASGDLLSGEIERIKDFLRFHGVLLVEGFGGWIALTHPSTSIAEHKDGSGVKTREIILASRLDSLQAVLDFRVGDLRAMEALSPGPLIVEVAQKNGSGTKMVCIPNNADLRDIASSLGGIAAAMIVTGVLLPIDVQTVLLGSGPGMLGRATAVLRASATRQAPVESPTIVRILAPGSVECLSHGALSLEVVRQATTRIAQAEIGDWT